MLRHELKQNNLGQLSTTFARTSLNAAFFQHNTLSGLDAVGNTTFMQIRWLSFLPYNLARELVNAEEVPERRSEAVGLFADVSGFTAISEALGRTGKAGSEELTDLLNSYFEPMIDLITSYGGIISKFGGDAMTVLFEYNPETRQAVIQRAIQCALQMQAQMPRYSRLETSAGNYDLAMKAGLAAGKLFCSSVGTDRREYIVAGEVIDLCASAEHQAERGEVIIHQTLLDSARLFDLSEKCPDFYQVKSAHGAFALAPLPPLPPIPAEHLEVAMSYLHPSLAARLKSGQGGFVNEHRKVTVLFIGFPNLNYDDNSDVGYQLQKYFNRVFNLVRKYGGYLNKIDMGDKGSKYIVLFGAPVAHENDEERALRCALELNSLEDVGALSVGVNTGQVYCGQVGSDLRQEYTVMGDTVNLAARLMQSAGSGQILVSNSTRQLAGGRFTWGDAYKLSVKGKLQPVEVCEVKGWRNISTGILNSNSAYRMPMVGRQAELQKVSELISDVVQGNGQLLAIEAEAGMGKTRLVEEITKLARVSGLQVLTGNAQSYGTAAPYLAWNDLWRNFFGLEPTWSVDYMGRYLSERLLNIDPELAPRLPILGVALNLSFPENDLTRPLDAKLRKTSLESLLVDCLRHEAKKHPMLFVIEDAHWLDSLSYDLLEAVCRNIFDRAVLVLVIHRPAIADQSVKPEKLSAFNHYTQLVLSEFTTAETRQLLSLKLNQLWGAKVAENEVALENLLSLTVAKAQGNPFYIEELVNLLYHKGVTPLEALELEMPDSLHSLIISRIDQLEENEKLTLKVASVIGQVFRASWVLGLFERLRTTLPVLENLQSLQRQDLTLRERAEPELEYLFKHILTREVAYETLSFASRETLHEQLALYIEETYHNSLDQYLSLLAYHFDQTQNWLKKREYLYKAAQSAQTVYANETALDLYSKVRPLLNEQEQVEVLLRIGQVLEMMARWNEANANYLESYELAAELQDDAGEASAERALGSLFIKQKRFAEAEPYLQRAQTLFEKLDDLSGVSLVLTELGEVYRLQGNNAEANQYYQKSLAYAELVKDTKQRLAARARVYKALGTLAARQGDFFSAIMYYEEGLSLTEQLGDKAGSANFVNNLSVIQAFREDFAAGRSLAERSVTLLREVGDRWGLAVALNNLGMFAHDQSDDKAARGYLEQSLSNRRKLGDRWGVANVLSSLTDVALSQQDYNYARACLTASLKLNLELNDKLALAYCIEYGAALAAAEQHAELALKLAGAALAIRQNINAPLPTKEKTLLEKRLVVAREQLNGQAEEFYANGANLALEEAVDLAMVLLG